MPHATLAAFPLGPPLSQSCLFPHHATHTVPAPRVMTSPTFSYSLSSRHPRHPISSTSSSGSALPSFVLPPLAPLLVAGFAAGLEALTRQLERRSPPGRLIALRNDGRRMHVIYHNPPSLHRQPCVVMEAGANSWSPMWDEVSARIEGFARVLRYDRPGFGFSDPCFPLYGPRSVTAVAEDLRAALKASDANPPYVFVAHSLGALYVNALLTYLAPDDVCGVVYVDAASPETVRMLEKIVPNTSPPRWLAKGLGSLGVLRLLAPLVLRKYADSFRGELKRQAIATWARGDWLMSYTGEWAGALRSIRGGLDGDEALQFAPGWLGEIPIAVLVPDVYQRTSGMGYITMLQSAVADYSTDARVIPVTDCGHFVQLDRPEVVAEAVEGIITRAREKHRWREECRSTEYVPKLSPPPS